MPLSTVHGEAAGPLGPSRAAIMRLNPEEEVAMTCADMTHSFIPKCCSWAFYPRFHIYPRLGTRLSMARVHRCFQLRLWLANSK